MAHWTGDEWRWLPEKHRDPTIYTIAVYELAEKPAEKPGAKRVPFGFSPREEEPQKPEAHDRFIDWTEVLP